MKPIQNYENVEVYGESKPFPIGPQICRIVNVTDVPEKSYLIVEFDVATGELKDYFKGLAERSGVWYGVSYRSYKDSALPFFKSFITAVEKSNAGYKWNWDETSLNQKLVVINFREEEYIYNGEVKSNIKPFEFRSISSLQEGQIESAPKKLSLKPEELATLNPPSEVLHEIVDDDLPF